jgi:hypothetical protein
VIFVGAGLVETHFTLTLVLIVLFAVLAAFGFLDGLILVNLQALRAELATRPLELIHARARLERLSRTVILGGAALGAAGTSAVLMLALQ